MSTNGTDRIGRPGGQKTVSRDQIEGLEHGDSIAEYGAVAFTDEGLYGVPATAAKEDVKTELGAEQAYVKVVSYEGEGRNSASAGRVNEEQLNELGAMAESPFAVLDGQVQERDQSTDAVYDRGAVLGSIDRI